MKLFSPVQLTRLTRPRDEVGVDRDLLPRAAAGQEPDENREVLEAGNELLYPHHDDVHRRNAGDEPGVTLVGNRGHGARLGHPEVGTRNADVGGQELLAQASAGEGAQGLDVGQGIEDSVAPDGGLVGEELDGVVELFVCDGPARPVVEALDPATYALVAAVLRLALQGWFPGLQDLNQPFRYRAPGRGGARGCRSPCASGGLPGASGNWSRLRSGCQRRSLPTPLSSRPPSRWTRRASSPKTFPRTRNTTPRSATPQGRVPPRSEEARTARRVRRARAAGDSRSGRRLSPPGVPRGPSRPSR